MKKILLALLVFLGAANAADMDLWKKSTLNKIVQRGELRIGLDPGYMPFEMKDKKGNIIGFDVDLARAMAKGMGVKLKIVPTAFDGVIGGLVADKFDLIISAITITQKRNLKINFSNPYMSIGQTLLVANKHKGKTWQEIDKKGAVITTKLGVTGEIVAKKLFKNAKIKTFDTEGDATQEVLNGKADAFIYDKPYNLLFMAKKGGKISHLEKDLSYEPLGIALKKGDPDFLNWINNFLYQIKNDGQYEKMYNKWFKSDAWLKRVQ